MIRMFEYGSVPNETLFIRSPLFTDVGPVVEEILRDVKENGLAPLETVAEISARFIANTASWQFRGEEIRTMCEKLGDIL